MLLQEEVPILKHLFILIYISVYVWPKWNCSDKLCKSAFQKYLAKKKKNKKSIKVVTVHNITEKKLHLDSIYYSQTQT